LKLSNTSTPAPAQTKYRSPAEAARARKAAAAASATSPQTTDKNKALDSHTYDKGYKRWETFDVDAELAKVDEEEQPGGTTALPRTTDAPRAPVARTKRRVVNTAASVPTISREELYKQDGNKHYKRGEFQLAIKCYTRCIASNPRNAVAYSNRAQAHVKLKNFLKAEEDCTSGILINPQFVKTWSRRGTARNSLGRHRKLVGVVGGWWVRVLMLLVMVLVVLLFLGSFSWYLRWKVELCWSSLPQWTTAHKKCSEPCHPHRSGVA
jgi:tetratricopeptide (TPR) repeat protein